MTPHDLLDPLLDASYKGFPATVAPLRRSAVGQQGWHLLDGRLPLPLAVIEREALHHNLGWLQALADRSGIDLAPHGKTTLSPQLFQAQLAAGAWGLTVASVGQLGVAVAAGAHRALIANQVLQAADLAALDALRRAHPGLRAPFLLDAAEQLDLVEAAAAAQPPAAPFEVLLELGLAGGRTGCRDDDAALALARRVRASPAVRLAGVAAYEGLWARGEDAADRALVTQLMARLHRLTARLDDEDLFETDEVIVTAGGSAVFDLVAQALRPAAARRRPVRPLLRSGCYLTHDDGFYARLVPLATRRLGCATGLQAALRVWAVVQSRPEPGLAILGAGKRDLSFDMGLPVPVAVSPAGSRARQPAPAHWRVTALNDQHAYLRLDPPEGDASGPAAAATDLAVGDRVALGISHPCTTFDRWRWMPVVDAGGQVVDAITTCF